MRVRSSIGSRETGHGLTPGGQSDTWIMVAGDPELSWRLGRKPRSSSEYVAMAANMASPNLNVRAMTLRGTLTAVPPSLWVIVVGSASHMMYKFAVGPILGLESIMYSNEQPDNFEDRGGKTKVVSARIDEGRRDRNEGRIETWSKPLCVVDPTTLTNAGDKSDFCRSISP
ncbi:hypothetical protein BT69DRAFT_1024170 [Atractiella rhizophila]|nr:hypothetical protein BT69DRAFT_1024170 [Atractiella rhizophila]